MEFIVATVHETSYLIIHYPLYSAIGSVFLFVGFLKFYCRLTMGICDVEQEMSGKTVLITGASAGIGKETARELARRNARVLLACRDVTKGTRVAEEIKASTGNPNVFVKSLELASFDSVRKCARDVIATEDKLHILINNAGIISNDTRKLTSDGCEITMQTNHFGHFLLTLLLLDLLKKSSPSRIINVSSSAHSYGQIDLEDLTNRKSRSPFQMYSNSKLANVLFTKELSARLSGTGITVNAVHPGCVKTDILKSTRSLITLFTSVLFLVVGKTPEEGAQTTIRAAVDPRLEKTTGKYFADCKEDKVSKDAEDKVLARRFFELSEQIVGVSF